MRRNRILPHILLYICTLSCTRHNGCQVQDVPSPILLSVCTDNTRSIISGPSLPGTYTVYASAYFKSPTAPETNGDYFVGEPFRLRSGTWTADPAIFWPAGGTLDFQAIACEDDAIDMGRSVRWHEGNCSEGVEVIFGDGDCLDSEVLFSAACSRNAHGGSVQMEFKHSQSLLQFIVNTETDILRIDRIVLENAYTGGIFRVSNNVYMDAEWNFRGHRRGVITVPGSEGLFPLPGKPSSCNILIPEQDACDIAVHYSVKNSPSSGWNTAKSSVFRHKADANTWFYGEKNTFQIGFSFEETTLDATVHEWAESTEDITVNH